MALFVIVADDCVDDAERHGQTSFLANLKESVEVSQNLPGFDFFMPTPFLKKSLGRSFRLIAYRVPFEEDELILFLRVLARGSGDYENFLNNWDKDTDGITRQFQPFDHAQLRTIHEKLTSIPGPPPPPQPSEEEWGWLYEVFGNETLENDLLVLETEVWVRKMRAAANRDFLALYHQLLEQVDTSCLLTAISNTDIGIHWGPNDRLGVVYLYRPDIQRFLLLEPVRNTDDVDLVLAEQKERLARTGEGQHALSRIAARSYPYLMVLDQDAWLAIQKDEEANLALSPEEAELLESIRRAGVKGELGYPLFINGRAGSGKSTMLQYLVADYLNFALRKKAAQAPIYMTSSRDLLQRARETVHGLLTAHHERLLEGLHDSAEVNALLDHSFVVFHEFLYSLLPSEEQKEFQRDRYVNYAKFRKLWSSDFAKRPEARHISPDVAWHTLRSYIKGIRSSCSDELAPEEFNALPRRRRSVSTEAFSRVYERVWSSWYKPLCDEEHYWDDQDLAARVLELGLAREIDCSAIFCDEAQDFTPAELDIIFQLSLFGRRSLQPEDLPRVPIVFAGDPLQTINPTGFRWDAVQADFHDRFHAVINPRRKARVEVSYRELRYNYRSNPGIVGFCNLIQLVRAALLGDRDIRPQEAWWVDMPVQTVWFALDNAQTQQQIEKRPDLVKLINCEEGEETDFVRRDPILKMLKEETEGIFRNVLGPTRAKGLEFPAVVVYRYGESAPKDFGRLLDGQVDLQDAEERLPYEYFFNRLYVAASRAKGQLVVVDSKRALESFWRVATNMDVIDRLVQLVDGAESWKSAITFLVPGKEEAWSGERIDPIQQAIEYANQGSRKRDPYLLRQAALAYRSGGNTHETGKCLALAAEFEANQLEAGNKYRELGLYEDAFRCYWEGRIWGPLCSLTAQEPSLTSRLESYAADFMVGTNTPHASLLNAVMSAVSELQWRSSASRDATWREVLRRLAERLSRTIEDATIAWPRLFDGFMSLAAAGVPIDDAHLAAIAYAAREFSASVELWERAGITDREEYRRAKANIAPFPTNLIWFGSLKEHKEVLQRWRQQQGAASDLSDLEDRVAMVIADAALAEGDMALAAMFLELRPDRDRVARLLATAVEVGDVERTSAAAVLAARVFVRTRAWTSAIRAAEDADFSELAGIRLEQVRSTLSKTNGTSKVFRAVLEELALSDDLTAETGDHQAPVTEFLHRHFIARGRPQTHGIPPEIIGAAIERAGRIVDALQFYENLELRAATEVQRKFAVERLVRNLEQYAEYLRLRGDERQARQRQVRAKQLRVRARLGDRRLPNYPVIRVATAHAGPTNWVRGPFRIVLSKQHGRLRVEHTERFETVTVNGKDGTLLGDAKFSSLQVSGEETAAWAIEGWDAAISLVNRGNDLLVVARFGNEPFEVPI